MVAVCAVAYGLLGQREAMLSRHLVLQLPSSPDPCIPTASSTIGVHGVHGGLLSQGDLWGKGEWTCNSSLIPQDRLLHLSRL